MVAEPGSAAVARRVAEEVHGRAVAAAEEAKETTEKLEVKLQYLNEKAEQEKTEEAYKEYFEAAGYLRGKKDE